ncbi:LysR family transcriptional regulator [Parendozoicomonas haliclonae]|uniref:HTH-type transcriptional activator AllS n=1 Tax=Parendozoicomonas haliclonae TaxID=1960125 RepID=A0A1X7AR18_9GAMM|nr:LysR family transcriptional regulator [Parendozoicomonas haliclonae]SMA50771.1 HTH-type transcriptional activator AllS [Parendozoicomonas haliclonae]
MLHAITLEALKALDAIDRKGSFAAAAESLHKVPSALTYTIKKLEDELGSPLFDRSQHRAQLTPAGQLMLERGRDILKATYHMVESVHQLETGWETHLRIARDTIIPSAPIFEAVAAFNQLGHQIDFSLTVESLGGGWDALHSQRTDIVIGALGEIPRGMYRTRLMANNNFIFTVARHHPLADFEGVLNPDDLDPYPAIVIPDSSQLLPSRDAGLVNTRQIIRVDTIENKIAAQLMGLGIGFLPRHLIQEHLESGALVEKTCYLPGSGAAMYIAWRGDQEGKALQWFIDYFSNVDWQGILKG